MKGSRMLGKLVLCVLKILSFLLFQKYFLKYDNYNNTINLLWLAWPVPAVCPCIPLAFPPFITVLHTTPHVCSCPTACS